MSNFHLRDISIGLAGDGYYYLTGTSTAVWSGSDGWGVIRLWRSLNATGPFGGGGGVVYNITRDCPMCNSSVPQSCSVSPFGRVRAPEFHYFPTKAADVPGSGGYFITHNFHCPGENSGVLASTTGTPLGPYKNLLWGAGGGDVSLFQDPADGEVYTVTSGGGGINANRLSENMTTIVATINLNPPCNGDCSTTAIGFEGPFLTYLNGVYYLSASAFGNSTSHGSSNSPFGVWGPNCSNCFYSTYAGRANTLSGPFLDPDGSPGGWLSVENGGHNVFFQTPSGSIFSSIWYGDRAAKALPDRNNLVDVPSIIAMHILDGRLVQEFPSRNPLASVSGWR